MKVERNGKEFELTKDELFWPIRNMLQVLCNMSQKMISKFLPNIRHLQLKKLFICITKRGHEEHLSIELAAGNYHTLTHEPTVKILSTESTEFDTGREMPLHEANSRFKDVDQLTHELYGDRSYDKTKFQLNFSLNGEQVVYEGVQNLGNLEAFPN